MSFDWKEYFELAKFVKNKQTSNFSLEASLRCAVSRSYYAAFCYARNYASDPQRFSSTQRYKPCNCPKDHSLLRLHFQKLGLNDPKMVNVATALDDLRQRRNDCDYQDVVNNPTDMFKDATADVNSVFKILV